MAYFVAWFAGKNTRVRSIKFNTLLKCSSSLSSLSALPYCIGVHEGRVMSCNVGTRGSRLTLALVWLEAAHGAAGDYQNRRSECSATLIFHQYGRYLTGSFWYICVSVSGAQHHRFSLAGFGRHLLIDKSPRIPQSVQGRVCKGMGRTMKNKGNRVRAQWFESRGPGAKRIRHDRYLFGNHHHHRHH